MSVYYYFAATLPMLLFNEPPRLSHDAFLEAAGRHLTPSDLRLLVSARLANFGSDAPRHPLFVRFQEWETNLRNRLAELRAAALKRGERSDVRPAAWVAETARVARAAFEAADPRQGEIIQDRARWEFLSMLEAGHQFDLDYIVGYSLKLQLLERMASLSQAAGEAAWRSLEADLGRDLLGKMPGSDDRARNA